jgi:hypothetical protein
MQPSMTASDAPLRSPRRAIAGRLLAVAGAVAAGLALQQVVAARLEAIQALSETDVVAARAALARVFQVAAIGIAGGVGGLGVAIALSSRRALAEGRFPPTGALAFGRGRAPLSGPPALRLARIGVGLGAALALLSLAAGGMLWWMARVLLLCRAA